MERKIDLSVIIVNYNTGDLLKECVVSIIKSINLNTNFEIIIIDNNSSDNSVKMSQGFTEVKILKNEENIGFAKANNQGLRIAKGEYVCFLNPDTIVHSNAIETLINYLKNDNEIGAVGPMLLNKDGSLQYSAYYLPSIRSLIYIFFNLRLAAKFFNNLFFKIFKKKLIPLSTERSYDEPFPAGWIIGACILMRRELALSLGGLDEEYFLYWEEIDLCKRLTDRGFKIYVVPEACVTHLIGQSTAKVKEFSLLQWYKNLSFFYKKNFSLLNSFLARIFLTISILLHLIIGGRFLKKNYFNRLIGLKILKIIWLT